MGNNYNLKEEFKKPWIHVSILFIALHIINFFIFSSSSPNPTYRIPFLYLPLGAMIITFAIVTLYPKYSKHRDGVEFSGENLVLYRKICSSAFVVVNLIYLMLMLLHSGKLFFNTFNFVLLFSAMLHLIVGITFIRLTPNRIIGLKFPWLLSNERAWKKTHRISAYIWITFGLIGIAVGLGLQVNEYMVLASFLPTIISLIISLFLSHRYQNIDC
ncbi:SdpI family protein [Paenibacillus sp. 1-18]|uniref:SdpI family protein n=1 Tax=Paenibacillus sp. 1-18 TaxID=1333846 RepID=UPI00046EB011|nr:SdpI family protein [Paenibacillus sp. 1-18]